MKSLVLFLFAATAFAGGKTDLPTLTLKGNSAVDTQINVDVVIEASNEVGRQECQDRYRNYHFAEVIPHRYLMTDVLTGSTDTWGGYTLDKVELNTVALNYLTKRVEEGTLTLPHRYDVTKYFERCGFSVKSIHVHDDKGSFFNIKDADYNDRPSTFTARLGGMSDGLFNLDYRWYDLNFTVNFK
jgi:hypothetical protein